MKWRLVILTFAITTCVTSQNLDFQLKKEDSTDILHKQTIYYLLQRSWVANQENSYLSIFPYTSSIGDRRIPLRQGEGVNSDLDLLEANLNLRFPLIFGREYGSGFRKRHRITLDYNGTFRMTLDDSKPLTPGNNKVGFSWHWSLYNNYTGWIGGKDENDSNAQINSRPENLNFLNFLFTIHHYSNGQAPGFFYVPDPLDPSEFRNSYLDGDFSTNYIYLEFTKGHYNKLKGSLHQASLGYRHELGSETSTFAVSKEQENSYGLNRFFLKYDYRTERFGKYFEYHVRGELEYILGNLDNFRANLLNDTDKYRLGAKGLIEIAPKSHRAIGYFVSFYYGRDYLNIRYDDIVFSAQVGISLRLDKFYMPILK